MLRSNFMEGIPAASGWSFDGTLVEASQMFDLSSVFYLMYLFMMRIQDPCVTRVGICLPQFGGYDILLIDCLLLSYLHW